MQTAKTLILAGGNGYIGGTTAFALKEAGFSPIILDDFSTSSRSRLTPFDIFEVDLRNKELVRAVMLKVGPLAGIIHFAAKALVPESFSNPYQYFENNILSSLNLADLAKELKVPVFIHSSSCAVYGIPDEVPIRETESLEGNSPYGDTKILSEILLSRYSSLGNFRLSHLRYFNPAGADLKNQWGEQHDPETHLIPNVVKAALKDEPLFIYGNQYPTSDGTCVRDFIHVKDLAEAHVRTLKLLLSGRDVPQCINIGSGTGTSVGEVIRIAGQVFGKSLRTEVKPARPGDPPQLVAETSLMRRHLTWEPQLSVAQMILDDWSWRCSLVK